MTLVENFLNVLQFLSWLKNISYFVYTIIYIYIYNCTYMDIVGETLCNHAASPPGGATSMRSLASFLAETWGDWAKKVISLIELTYLWDDHVGC